MTDSGTPDLTSDINHLFEIIRTTRSIRRRKPDRVPNDLIRKILEGGVCAPNGGNAPLALPNPQ
jgi:nitroreductase